MLNGWLSPDLVLRFLRQSSYCLRPFLCFTLLCASFRRCQIGIDYSKSDENVLVSVGSKESSLWMTKGRLCKPEAEGRRQMVTCCGHEFINCSVESEHNVVSQYVVSAYVCVRWVVFDLL